MKIFGLDISRSTMKKDLVSVADRDRSWFRIFESYAGAWQQNVEVDFDTVLTFHAVFACVTLIASDIAKLRVKLVEFTSQKIWKEVSNPAYSPVLRKPNSFQNRIQFLESWVLSKLLHGNTYILKQRDGRGVVVAMTVLDPNRVRVLVSEQGAVFYELMGDNVVGINGQVAVPAREIIHDRFNCFHHPLVGLSPIYASGLPASQGLGIQNNSTNFFENRSIPGGVLTAPGAISNDTALRLKNSWDTNYSGTNRGKVAVLGDGLKFEQLTITAVDSQLIEQLKWSAEVVCSAFHVPPYKIGIGPMPAYNNIQALNVEYYSQCLQILIESAELCLDEGLATGDVLGTEFDVDGLLRMDSITQMSVLKDGVSAGIVAPNEGRKKIDYESVEGGDSPYLQQQNFSLAALAKRDARDDPFGKGSEVAPAPPTQREFDNEKMNWEWKAKSFERFAEYV